MLSVEGDANVRLGGARNDGAQGMKAGAAWAGLVVALMAAGCGGRSERNSAPGAGGEPVGAGQVEAGGTGAGGGTTAAEPGACACDLGDACDARACRCPGTICDGRCVDPKVDAAHCGACGLACPSGCDNGRCVEVLASGLHSPDAVAVGRSELYVTTSAGLLKVSKRGGAVSVVDPDLTGISHAIAIDDAHVYWSRSNSGELMRASIAGGMPERLAKGNSISAIAFHSSTIYWADWRDGTIMTLPKSGGTPSVLTWEARRPSALAVDDERIYWTEDIGDAGGAVVSVPLGGGTPRALATGQDAPRGMAINLTHVYWTTAFGDALARVPLHGGRSEMLFDESHYAERVVLDDSFAYWVNAYAVFKTGLDGSTHEELPAIAFPADVAVDDESIYVLNNPAGPSNDECTVLKLTPK